MGPRGSQWLGLSRNKVSLPEGGDKSSLYIEYKLKKPRDSVKNHNQKVVLHNQALCFFIVIMIIYPRGILHNLHLIEDFFVFKKMRHPEEIDRILSLNKMFRLHFVLLLL